MQIIECLESMSHNDVIRALAGPGSNGYSDMSEEMQGIYDKAYKRYRGNY